MNVFCFFVEEKSKTTLTWRNKMNEMQRTSLVSQLSRNYGTLQARCSLSKQFELDAHDAIC
jgi:hypothetical protein